MDPIQRTLAALAVALLIIFTARIACCQDAPTPEVLAAAIQTWQPTIEPERATRLSTIILEECEREGLSPWIVAAMIMRESSYRLDVEEGRRLGDRGELGLMQLAPAIAALAAPPGCSADLPGPRCQVGAGARWLAVARQRCPGPWVRWVAGYGMRRCPGVVEAEGIRGVRRVRAWLAAVGVVR